MEYTFDYDLVGEIMIPLTNNNGEAPEEPKSNRKNFNNKIKINPLGFRLESILEGKNFKDFRSILFQGELLRFFIILKMEKTKNVDILKLINDIHIKFEFDSSCNSKNYEIKKSEDKESLKKSLKGKT